MTIQQTPQFEFTAVPDPSLSQLAGRDGSVARFKAVTGFPHSRTTTVVLGKPVTAGMESLADGTTVAKLVHTLDQLMRVPAHRRRQPVEKVKVILGAEAHQYAGRGVEVLVDFTGEIPQMELVFDQILDSNDARGWTLSAFDAAAAQLCADNASGPCSELAADRTAQRPDGTPRQSPGTLPA